MISASGPHHFSAEEVKTIEHTFAPAGISFAWPLMLPEHTGAAGRDYFDTNIKAVHQTDITAREAKPAACGAESM